MKTLRNKKIFIPLVALFLCVVVAVGTFATATYNDSNITINVNASDTVKKNSNSTEDVNFVGLGVNDWGMDIGPESIELNSMTDAYFEINAQRLLKMKPRMVRFMVQPYYLCYMGSETKGEAEWTAGNLNYNSVYMYNVWRYLEAFEAAGTEVFLNWGYSYIEPMQEWFAIKDVPSKTKPSKRSAPRDLQAFADNLAIFLTECQNRGFNNIKYVSFYNEVMNSNSEFTAFADKRTYWVSMLKLVHEALVEAGFRDASGDRSKHEVLICGMDSANNGTTLEDFGATPSGTSPIAFMDYVYNNAYLEGYCDVLDSHQYLRHGAKGNQLSKGTNATGFVQELNDKWQSVNGGLNFIIAEMGTNYIEPTEGTYNGASYSGRKAGFNQTMVSQMIGNSLGGATASLNWSWRALYFPMNAGFNNDEVNCAWRIPSRYDEKNPTKYGIDNVGSTYGSYGLPMRYVPKDSKVAKSTASTTSAIVASYMTATDTAIVVEYDYANGFDYATYKTDATHCQRNVTVNLDGRTGKQYYKYTYEYPDGSFIDTDAAWNMYDGNAILNDGVKIGTAASSTLNDTISGNHCLVIYSTIPPLQQIELKTVELECSKDGNVTVEVENVYNLSSVGVIKPSKFNFEVYRGNVNNINLYTLDDEYSYVKQAQRQFYLDVDCAEYKNSGVDNKLDLRMGTIDTNGVYTPAADAKIGDTVAIRVTAKSGDNTNLSSNIGDANKRLQVYDTDAYAIAIIKIVA